MDCKHFEENIAAYVEGLVGENRRQAMDKHRATCQACNRLARVHGFILTSLNTTEPVRAPAGLAARILGTVETEKARVVSLPFSWRKTLIEVLAASVVLFAIFLPFTGAILRRLSLLSRAGEQVTANLMIYEKWLAGLEGLLRKAQLPPTWLSTLEEGIHLFVEPLPLPYIPVSVPPYFLAALGLLAWSMWMYFGSPAVFPVASFTTQRERHA